MKIIMILIPTTHIINNINLNDINYYPYLYSEYHNNNIDPRYKIKQNNKNDISNKTGNEIWGDDLNDDDSNFPKGKNEKELFEKNKIEKYKKMNMMILKMEMILKELKQLLLIIFVLLLIYFIIFYQVHFKKMFQDMENFIKKDIYINY